jgi:protoheme IX farnesyltransferase
VVLTAGFAVRAALVAAGARRADKPMFYEKRLFAFSILYLFAMFGALVVDRWVA